MRMDLAGERFQVEEGYEVRLPPGDHLIVVAGARIVFLMTHPPEAGLPADLPRSIPWD